MANEKMQELNKIKEDLFALYPNSVSIQLTIEGDKITVKPTEKYEIKVDLNEEEE